MESTNIYKLHRSSRKDKKYMIKYNNKTIHFGSKGMSDYTIHRDDARRIRYLIRHKKNEKWTKSGILTAGFWSRWLLWEKTSI